MSKTVLMQSTIDLIEWPGLPIKYYRQSTPGSSFPLHRRESGIFIEMISYHTRDHLSAHQETITSDMSCCKPSRKQPPPSSPIRGRALQGRSGMSLS